MAWEQLASVLREQQERVLDHDQVDPVACWYDGEPLTTDPGGQLRCRFCGRVPMNAAGQ